MDDYTEPKDAMELVWGPKSELNAGTLSNQGEEEGEEEEEEDRYSEPYQHVPGMDGWFIV